MKGKVNKTQIVSLLLAVFVTALTFSGGKATDAATGNVLQAQPIQGALPLEDLDSPLWEEAQTLTVSLSGQSITLPGGTIGPRSVTVRALHNEKEIAFLLSWEDPRPDTGIEGTDGFRDAVALEFPMEEGQVPFFGMGRKGDPVNIWQWKADWSSEVTGNEPSNGSTNGSKNERYRDWTPPEEWEEFRPGVGAGNIMAQPPGEQSGENLLAEGFGTITTAEVQDVKAYGIWRDSRWHVVFQRDFQPQGEGTLFKLNRSTRLALAVWDGELQNRGSRKSLSTWMVLELPADPAAQAARRLTTVLVTGLAGLLICLVSYLALREKSKLPVER